MQAFTFRMGEDGFREELIYRGMHSMLSKRLLLWRLKDLSTERVDSAEDVNLYRVTGKDERLICLAEVRDLTPVRDASGHVVALPNLERTLSKCLIAIRREQSTRTSGMRFQWNRVHLFLWPPLDLSQEEINGIIHKLAPETTGLGLERIVVQGTIRNPASGKLEEKLLDVSNRGRAGTQRPASRSSDPSDAAPQRVRAKRRPVEPAGFDAPVRDHLHAHAWRGQ